MSDERIAQLRQEAIAAHARGDWQAERNALDALALLEAQQNVPPITCKGYGPPPEDEEGEGEEEASSPKETR